MTTYTAPPWQNNNSLETIQIKIFQVKQYTMSVL